MAYVHDVDTPTETAEGTLEALAVSLERVGFESGDTMIDLVMRLAAKAARDAARKI